MWKLPTRTRSPVLSTTAQQCFSGRWDCGGWNLALPQWRQSLTQLQRLVAEVVETPISETLPNSKWHMFRTLFLIIQPSDGWQPSWPDMAPHHGPRSRVHGRSEQTVAGLGRVEPPFQKDGSILIIILGLQEKIGKKMEKNEKEKTIYLKPSTCPGFSCRMRSCPNWKLVIRVTSWVCLARMASSCINGPKLRGSKLQQAYMIDSYVHHEWFYIFCSKITFAPCHSLRQKKHGTWFLAVSESFCDISS